MDKGKLNLDSKIEDYERTIGKRLNIIRLRHGLTQSDIAAFSALTYQQIGKFESGETRITAGLLYHIGKMIGVSPVSFFPNENEILKLESMAKSEVILLLLVRQISRQEQNKCIEVLKFLLSRSGRDSTVTELQMELGEF